MMHGHLLDVDAFDDERPLDKVFAVCQTLVGPLVPSAPHPDRNAYSLSVFSNEMWLTEHLVNLTRFG